MHRILAAWLLGVVLWSSPCWADTTVCVEVKLHSSTTGISHPPPEVPSTVHSGSATPAVSGEPAAAAAIENSSAGDAAGLSTEQRQLLRLRQQVRTAQRATSVPPAASDPSGVLPLGQNPLEYLKRLLEHFVTHERGFRAVDTGCVQHLEIELYPLLEGFTAFARYSGTGREERVDHLYTDELSQFAERATLALLYGRQISATILRDTVLRSDSKRAVQRIRGTNHFTMNIGTDLRGGQLPTALSDGSGGVSDQIRVFTPMALGIGYRGKFESWGIESTLGVGIGTSQAALSSNALGGHTDFGGDVALSLHFLHYLNPRGLSSVYLGAGSSFELIWFSVIKPRMERGNGDRSTLVSGGLDVDLLVGVEFMRASRAQFYLQGALQLPAYAVDSGDSVAHLSTWLPGISLKLGIMF